MAEPTRTRPPEMSTPPENVSLPGSTPTGTDTDVTPARGQDVSEDPPTSSDSSSSGKVKVRLAGSPKKMGFSRVERYLFVVGSSQIYLPLGKDLDPVEVTQKQLESLREQAAKSDLEIEVVQ